MAKAKWRCASCGAANDESLARCRLCQATRPESGPPPGPPGYLRPAEPQDGPGPESFEIPLREEPRPAPPMPEPDAPSPSESEPPAPRPPLFQSSGDRIVTYGDQSPAPVPTEDVDEPAPYEPYEPYEYGTEAPDDNAEGADDADGGWDADTDTDGADDWGDADAPPAPVGVGLPPLFGMDEPDTVAPPPAPPSGPDKRLIAALGAVGALVLIVVSVLVLNSGSSPSSTLSPSETVGELLPVTTARPGPDVPTENRAAVAMLPTKADFGDLWSQIELRAGADAFELGPNPSSAQCVLPPPAVPEAGARVDLVSYFEGGAVAAQVKVFPDATSASNDVNTPPISAEATSCLQSSTAASLGKRGIADLVTVEASIETLGSPGLGEESSAYRFTLSISAGSQHLVQHLDVQSFRVGRTVGVLTVSAGYNADNSALLGHARDVFSSRFVSQ